MGTRLELACLLDFMFMCSQIVSLLCLLLLVPLKGLYGILLL